MGPFYILNAALVGILSIAAVYHLFLWCSSRREPLLAVISADYGVRAVLCIAVLAFATSATSAEAQRALQIRIGLGILLMVTWVWSVSLISGVRARRFVWFVTVIAAILLPIHFFVMPLNSSVIAVESYVLPWGEIISNPRLGIPGWSLGPVYAYVLSIELFGFYCGFRLWGRDRVAGTLILMASCAMLLLHVAHFLRVCGVLHLPHFVPVGHMFWAGALGILIARKNLQMRQQLADSEQRFRGIFDQTFQFIGLTTTDGTIIEVNRTTLDFVGIREEDVVGKSLWATPCWANSPSFRDRLKQAVAEAASGQTVRFEATYSKSDGNLVHMDFSVKPIRNERGEITLLIPEGCDVTDRKRAEELLRVNHHRLEVLSRQLIATQETERRHLARELHDQIGQVLTAIKMNLRRTHQSADASLQSQLEENVEMVDQAIVQVRNLSLSLRPPQLDELGLVAALHWLIKHQANLGGFEDHLDIDLGDAQIPGEIETVCFRIAQEALTNAVRHGEPRNVHIRLRATEKEFNLTIHDDGIGFDFGDSWLRNSRGDSIGLISMQERASLVGGRVEIESAPGNGTRIAACFPL